MTTETDHAEQNARGWMKSIREMVAALDAEKDDHEDDLEAQDKAREAIKESVLSVQVRSSEWHAPGIADRDIPTPDQFEVLLSIGGPALRIFGSLIFGSLDRYSQPDTVRLQKQDWGTPWTDVRLDPDDQKALERFTSTFWFGE